MARSDLWTREQLIMALNVSAQKGRFRCACETQPDCHPADAGTRRVQRQEYIEMKEIRE